MLNRRRFLSVAATAAVLGSVPGRPAFAASAASPAPTVWKGVAMGAVASMTLVHPDRAQAQAMIARCMAEVERLESIFSLYRADSALSRLNAAGRLDDPQTELVQLLSFGLSLAQASGGAFDPSVQPLLRLYFDHFSRPGASPQGPTAAAIAQARQRVGFADVEVGLGRIRLGRPGAAITLNGLAQGFITDRVADLLQANGFDNVLIDLGEGRALGHRPDGAPWRAGVADPAEPGRTLFELPLGSARGQYPALASSGGYGTRFGPNPALHHLLDPRTGRSANHHAAVSVAAPRATLADGLSTTLLVLSPEQRTPLLANYPTVRTWFVDAAGHVTGPDGAPAGGA
ncbi:FAD:protein FMN transferase [Luteimonas sp. YGD11-2]|uniref:FAD:protein FMN transferase n=1 Tax=Luteimonas sp. YGD11-2 TaxID=2508168 RepID=UPI00100B3D48|nr:FAD:protein FMN transferase [Luteimonas sp. YGD11-2]